MFILTGSGLIIMFIAGTLFGAGTMCIKNGDILEGIFGFVISIVGFISTFKDSRDNDKNFKLIKKINVHFNEKD